MAEEWPGILTRRRFLEGSVAAALFLAACGKDPDEQQAGNETTSRYYAYAPGWVPDPGNYRKSMWEKAGFADGPNSWEDLREGGSKIKSDQGVQLGIGMSQEIDSDMAARGLIWSHGGALQDENENVTINSPETVAATEFMKSLFEGAMTDEVFAWNPASNNQGFVAGKLSYILNSISAYRTLQKVNPGIANDVYFVKALEGPKERLAAQAVVYDWIVPNHAKDVDAAKEFLLHYTENYARATWESELYDFPAFQDRVPDLESWLDDDPFGSKPADKLSVLKDALDWSTNVGYKGSANTETSRRSTVWTSRRRRASTSCCSGPRAAARPRCCGRSRGWSRPPTAR